MSPELKVRSLFISLTATACVDPPSPGNQHNLVALYDYNNHTEILFGTSVFYGCKQGYHFTDDYHRQNVSVACKADKSGNWDVPDEWKTCVLPSGWCCRMHIQLCSVNAHCMCMDLQLLV